MPTLAVWSLEIYVNISREMPFHVCALGQQGGRRWRALGIDIIGIRVYVEV